MLTARRRPEAEGEGASSPTSSRGRRTATGAGRLAGWPARRVAAIVLLLTLAVTGVLTGVSYALYNSNEDRLLRLRTRELGLVLQEVLPSVQTPLASAALLADATGGSPQRFESFMSRYVGPGRPFVSASLWAPGSSTPVAVVGEPSLLAASPARARAFLERVEGSPLLHVTLVQAGGSARLGYAFSTPGNPRGYIAYGASALAPHRLAPPAPPGSPFTDVDYALYLGRSERPSDLLATNLPTLPVRGRRASETVAFGSDALTIVVSPHGSLAGGFPAILPWIIAAVGVVLALTGSLFADRLVRRRREAVELAASLDASAEEVRELYREQQQIAHTLQEAILPDKLPIVPGLETFASYTPGASGIDVGGDWFALIDLGAGRVVAMVGDVSGRGLKAATTMAMLRTAAFAYAAQDSRPSVILDQLGEMVQRRGSDGYFATVLCMRIDVGERVLTLASAGHLPPLVLDGGEARYLPVEAGVPVGVPHGHYRETSVALSPRATVLAFTDGLVERRGEVIDAGLDRLRDVALAARGQRIDELVHTVMGQASHRKAHDDIAILALRWQN